jgi:hypothetical protein
MLIVITLGAEAMESLPKEILKIKVKLKKIDIKQKTGKILQD